MYCSKCGKLNDSDAKFCTGCGAALAQKTYCGNVENKPCGGGAQTGYGCRGTAYEAPGKERPAVDPSRTSTLGIIAMVMAFLVPLVGLVLGLIDYNTQDGYNKNISKWAMIASGVILVLRIIITAMSTALSTSIIRMLVEMFQMYM